MVAGVQDRATVPAVGEGAWARCPGRWVWGEFEVGGHIDAEPSARPGHSELSRAVLSSDPGASGASGRWVCQLVRGWIWGSCGTCEGTRQEISSGTGRKRTGRTDGRCHVCLSVDTGITGYWRAGGTQACLQVREG